MVFGWVGLFGQFCWVWQLVHRAYFELWVSSEGVGLVGLVVMAGFPWVCGGGGGVFVLGWLWCHGCGSVVSRVIVSWMICLSSIVIVSRSRVGVCGGCLLLGFVLGVLFLCWSNFLVLLVCLLLVIVVCVILFGFPLCILGWRIGRFR